MKLKNRKWAELSRSEKLAAVLYPRQASKEIQAEMQEIAKREGKKPPTSNKKENRR